LRVLVPVVKQLNLVSVGVQLLSGCSVVSCKPPDWLIWKLDTVSKGGFRDLNCEQYWGSEN
jgi:hypothetical protein